MQLNKQQQLKRAYFTFEWRRKYDATNWQRIMVLSFTCFLILVAVPPQPARAVGPYRNPVHSTQLRAVCLYYRSLVATRIPRCQTARRTGVNTADGAKLHGGGDADMLHQSDIRECGARAWRPIPVVRRDCPCAGCQLQNPAFCACGIAGKCLYFMHGTD